MLIATFDLLYDIEKFNKVYQFIVVDILLILSFVHIGEYLGTAIDINNLRNVWEYRENYIAKQKDQGKDEIKVDVYYSQDKHNPTYGLADLFDDKNYGQIQALQNTLI